MSLGGSASDNKGVTRVTWSNSRGGRGRQGTGSWFVSGISLQLGTNVLTVTAFDQAGNHSNDTLTVIYQTPRAGQTITFPAIADRTFGDLQIPLAAAATSGLDVSFNVLNGPASLSSNLLTLTGAGGVTVRASQAGDDQFNAAPAVDRSFYVAKADQAITFAPVPAKLAGDGSLHSRHIEFRAAGVFRNVLGPATLSSNLVTLLAAGTVTVSAWQPGDSNYNGAVTVQQSFTVGKLPQWILFGALSKQVVGDAPFALSASASSGLPVDFSVLTGPAVVSGSMATITGPGLVVLRASQPGDSTYASAPDADQVLIVAPGNNVVTDCQRLGNGMFTLRYYGDAGTDYVVVASTNLVNWLPLATNQVRGLGYLEFTDISSTNFVRRFYRVGRP